MCRHFERDRHPTALSSNNPVHQRLAFPEPFQVRQEMLHELHVLVAGAVDLAKILPPPPEHHATNPRARDVPPPVSPGGPEGRESARGRGTVE